MMSWQTLGTEVSALGAAALSLPLRLVLARDQYDPTAPHSTPVVLVHGFFGDPTNFLVLRGYLSGLGARNFASFSYTPRLDYQRLAVRLAAAIELVQAETGAPTVDVVGHSLGGLVARYLIEIMGEGAPVRRLVTLGAPYFASPLPERELAIFAASDPFIPPPHPAYGPRHTVPSPNRVVVVPDCGHWGLLYHPAVMREAASFLVATAPGIEFAAPATLALEAS